MDPQPRLIEFGDQDMQKRDAVGGKAATLGLLAAAGFPVPPGFVVTAAVVEQLGDDLAQTLTAAADRLGPGPFAVRSSATAEDLPDASYAGLYETYLNVTRAELGDAVDRCFAAAAGYRITAYRAARAMQTGSDTQTGQRGARPAMAVLVQHMVPAEVSGVAFTANPVTGDRDEVVVTAVRGLAERLVSGEATGEEWVISGQVATPTRVGGNRASAVAMLRAANLARAIANRFGVPQDVEWAFDSRQRLHLLQARPMTALPDPVEWAPPGPGLWSRNFRLGEWLPEAMTPLFADWPLPRIEAGYLDGMRDTARVTVPFRYAAVNGWYYNATPIPSPRLLLRVLRDSRGTAPWFLYNALIRVSRNPAAADRAVLSALEQRWRDQILPGYRVLVETAEREVDTAGPPRLMWIVDEICRMAGEYLWSLAIVGGSAWKMEAALGVFCRKHLAGGRGVEAGEFPALLRGLPGAEPSYPQHAVHSLDWYHPTAGETDRWTATPPVLPAAGRSGELSATRQVAETTCRNALRGQPRLLARFDEILAVSQRFAAVREEQARDLSLGWPVLRRCVHRIGADLQTARLITAADDIYFLSLAEVTGALAGAATTRAAAADHRRQRWQRQRRLIAPLTLGHPSWLIGDPIARAVEAARTTHDLPDGAIIGHPASAGRATGRVHIIDGPADFAGFRDGEILVARATTPAWTPLFGSCAAVVTDGGTLAAHASLIAREYGIPAVVGAGDATTRLRTGQLVIVDGGAGTVLPIDTP